MGVFAAIKNGFLEAFYLAITVLGFESRGSGSTNVRYLTILVPTDYDETLPDGTPYSYRGFEPKVISVSKYHEHLAQGIVDSVMDGLNEVSNRVDHIGAMSGSSQLNTINIEETLGKKGVRKHDELGYGEDVMTALEDIRIDTSRIRLAVARIMVLEDTMATVVSELADIKMLAKEARDKAVEAKDAADDAKADAEKARQYALNAWRGAYDLDVTMGDFTDENALTKTTPDPTGTTR